ncbi:hypothetical protein AGMMS49975_04340 [Clostridia bacterium]|nr:hypothetical protein AGMMS49975_04340 [Clostridia bacterium]GHU77428.1 hypothetical protein FACS1894188_11680 [Clostridia bacterium]
MIREIRQTDLEILGEMYYKLFTSEGWKFEWLEQDNVRRYLKDMYEINNFRGYVYIYENILLGCCFGEASDYFSAKQFVIKEIYMDLKVQRRGLGTLFLSEIEEDLKENGFNNVMLYTVKTIPAYEFYHKNGYIDGDECSCLAKFLQE